MSNYNEKISNKIETPASFMNTAIYRQDKNINHHLYTHQNLQSINDPKTVYSEPVSLDNRNQNNKYYSQSKNSFESNNPKTYNNSFNELRGEPENIIRSSKVYQNLFQEHSDLVVKFKEQTHEIYKLNEENNKLKTENFNLCKEKKQILEEKEKDKISYENKIKELDQKLKKNLEQRKPIFNQHPGPRSFPQKPVNPNKNKNSKERKIKLNQEIFDIKDPKELSSLLLAMKLQSETMPEIDGIPLQTYLSNLAENNNIIELYEGDENDMMGGDQLDPDHMTYEQMLEIGDQIGNVSKGLSLKEITNVIKSCLYSKGRMKNEQESCLICLKEFFNGEMVQELKNCQHIYHSPCITEWLKNEKFCPICKKEVI